MKISEYIIWEDEQLVAINKPSGLLTIPDRKGNISLKNHLQAAYGEIFTVHRLDCDTSGIVVFARNESAHKQLSQLFEGREVEKYYQGLVLGKPVPPSSTIDMGIIEHPVKKGMMAVNRKGKPSVTDYEVVESFRLFSWMQFRIHTGRTHQIRVHMKHLGHPIVCDELYGDGKPVLVSTIKKNYHLSKSEEAERPLLGRLGLHSWWLKFSLGGKEYDLKAELPKDLRAVLNQLQKASNK
ncbi:RluA family pseudouridine synthase [Paraflavisolibacter sp. H34]|uniref:RluA family pseudouridine synthase n=1 Tax=Huijunlia imazamoxiresistens TaxID=3127457 RepID=UPI003015BC07